VTLLSIVGLRGGYGDIDILKRRRSDAEPG